MNDEIAVKVHISGRVQGVGFRFFTREKARTCGVKGYVRNSTDGGVEVVAHGQRNVLETFIGDLQEGPPASRVDEAIIEWFVPSTGGDKDFTIQYW